MFSLVLVFLVGAGEPVGYDPFIRGDMNWDGRVNIVDAVIVIHGVFGGDKAATQYMAYCPDAADVNDDNRVTYQDGIYLLNFLFRGRAQPMPPFPAMGLDPPEEDGETLGCGGMS